MADNGLPEMKRTTVPSRKKAEEGVSSEKKSMDDYSIRSGTASFFEEFDKETPKSGPVSDAGAKKEKVGWAEKWKSTKTRNISFSDEAIRYIDAAAAIYARGSYSKYINKLILADIEAHREEYDYFIEKFGNEG